MEKSCFCYLKIFKSAQKFKIFPERRAGYSGRLNIGPIATTFVTILDRFGASLTPYTKEIESPTLVFVTQVPIKSNWTELKFRAQIALPHWHDL